MKAAQYSEPTPLFLVPTKLKSSYIGLPGKVAN